MVVKLPVQSSPVQSPGFTATHNLGCVKCDDFQYGWAKYIAASFLPLTFFYLIVIVFRITATSLALNGYVLVSQLLATPTVLRDIYTSNTVTQTSHIVSYESQYLTYSVIAVYAVWNLDFHICGVALDYDGDIEMCIYHTYYLINCHLHANSI